MFPYDSCFKELSNGREPESRDLNYHLLLEGHLGNVCVQGQNHTPGILSLLEKHVRDPRQHSNQMYQMPPPTPQDTRQRIEEEIILDNTSDSMAAEEGAASDANQSQESITQSFAFETASPEVNNRVAQQLRMYTAVEVLSKYTILVEEYSVSTGVKPVYEYLATQVQPMNKFTCTVTFQGIKIVGSECGSKKQAKHVASRALWKELQWRRWV